MTNEPWKEERTERITEWVTGGNYAVAVEVEATFYPDRPGEPYLTPETVRYLEKVQALAEAGDVEELKKAGRVYVCMEEGDEKSVAHATDAAKKVVAAAG